MSCPLSDTTPLSPYLNISLQLNLCTISKKKLNLYLFGFIFKKVMSICPKKHQRFKKYLWWESIHCLLNAELKKRNSGLRWVFFQRPSCVLCYQLLCLRQQQGYLYTVKTLILQHISAPNGSLTCPPSSFSLITLLSLHFFFGAFPHSLLLYVLSAENRQ